MTTNPLLDPIQRAMVVVKVITPRKLVINRGSEDDIRLGQRFIVYILGEQMIDPSDGRELGRLEIVKGRGKVVHLQAKIATIESTEVESSRVRKTGGGFSYLMHGSTPELNETFSDAPFEDPEEGDLCRPI